MVDYSIKILIVCEAAKDYRSYSAMLNSGTVKFSTRHLDSLTNFTDQFEAFGPDSILIDIPSKIINVPEDLLYFSAVVPQIPLMIISHQDSVENAVACMKAGAADYLLKNSLAFLPDAVDKATCNARFGQQNRAACNQNAADIDGPPLALADTSSCIWDWNIVSNEVAFSERLQVMLGFENCGPENRFQEWKSRIHPDDLSHVIETLGQHLENKTPVYKSEYRILAKNGTYIWISEQGKVLLRNNKGSALRMAGTSTDIANLKKRRESSGINLKYTTLLSETLGFRLFPFPVMAILNLSIRRPKPCSALKPMR